MDRATDADVVVVGAEPVGLTLAIDLAARGVDVTALETRHAGEPPNVKCNQVSARSMEIFRRLGIAEGIRAAGLPAEYRNDVSGRTSRTSAAWSLPISSATGDLIEVVGGAWVRQTTRFFPPDLM